MSLLRLLSAGKSLVGMDDSARRYRDAGAGMLPKFGSKKNPFRTTVKVEPAPAERRDETVAGGAPKGSGAAQAAPADPNASERMQSRGGARSLARLGEWSGKCVDKLGGWLGRRERSPSALPHFNKAPMQTEMSLDRVRVLRNDLSDADLELVPARTSAKPSAAAAKPTTGDQPAEKAQLQLSAVTPGLERAEPGQP